MGQTIDDNINSYQPPQVNLSDGSVIGVSIFLNDDNAGKYYSFSGASDGIISFDWDLDYNGNAYDGSDLAIVLFGRMSEVGGVGDTVGWIVDYHFVTEGENTASGATSIPQQNVDVSAHLQDEAFTTQLGTMAGVLGKTKLQVTLTRNGTGAGADTFSGNWEGTGIKLLKL